MTDKQQIEKFATDLCKACRKSLKTCECKYPCVKAELVAEALYNAGYRKVDENAVVLTREEFDKLVEMKEKAKFYYKRCQVYGIECFYDEDLEEEE